MHQDSLHRIVAQAGDIIMRRRNQALEKLNNASDTSEPADIAANEFIVAELKKATPDISIFTEESAEHKSGATTRWIVDPLDGTTPWAWGNSGFSVSIALEQGGQVIEAAVYDPVMEEFFYAAKGNGATRNGHPIHTSSETDLKNMLMVVDWGNKDDKRREGLEYYTKFMVPDMFSRRLVPQFAPALGLCRIAEGRTHALICNDTWVEDHAAGSLILQEAGGCCTNFYIKESFDHRQSGIIAAATRDAHSQIVDFLKT
jgi:myo-inositol-1(or 4)-monophosphatase